MNDRSYAAALRESLAAREEKKPCCRRSYAAGLAGESPPDFACAGDAGCYLRGVFVRCGSMTDPDKGYYRSLRPGAQLEAAARLLDDAGLPPGRTVRRGVPLLYYRDSGKIEDFLALVGQSKHALELMDKKITRALRNNANRAVNCDSANVQRAVTAASRQTEAIERVLAAKGRESLPPALRETAALRLAHPEMSLEELGRLCDPPVGKSGINHRLRKLEIMAQELDGQETAENAGEGKADGADD